MIGDVVASMPALRRLHPGPPGPTTLREAYDVPRPAPRDGRSGPRPWVGLCMISSLDGAVAVDGKSGPLGNPNDRELLITLRELADVIVVGAGTARGEGYGPPGRPGLRVGVVTNSGSIDIGSALFRSGAGFVITSETANVDSGVDVLRAGRDRLDLELALHRLDSIVAGVRYVQVEGGPTLNGALLAADLIDELDLTMSPRLVGSDSPRVTSAAPALDARFALAHLLADDEHFLFGRWVRWR
jgi:riboflavin biosynthesis pyrimidine reductase